MLEVGDRITCHDFEDLLQTMNDLESHGVETDFNFYDPDHHFVLEVMKIGEKNDGKAGGSDHGCY